jgi:hypothetical protein
MHPDVFFGPRGASGLLHGLSHRLARDSGLHLDPLRATRGTRRAAAAAGLPWAGFGAVEGVQSAGAGGTGMCGVRGGGLDWEWQCCACCCGPIKLSGCV